MISLAVCVFVLLSCIRINNASLLAVRDGVIVFTILIINNATRMPNTTVLIKYFKCTRTT